MHIKKTKKGNNHTEIDKVTDYLNASGCGVSKLRNDYKAIIIKIADLLMKSKGKRIFTCGNGGSSAAASHMVNDLLICSNLNVTCLSDNTSTITAIANDLEYQFIFSEQLKRLAKEGDILIVFSGSGNSPNILNALEVAGYKKMRIIACVGTNGGKVISDYKKNLDFLVHIPIPMSNYEDASVVFIHVLMEILRQRASKPPLKLKID